MRRGLCALVIPALMVGAADTAAARPAQQASLAEGSVMDAITRLKAGEYLWAPEIAPNGPMLMIVNVQTQRAVVYRNGVPIGVTTISTGRPSHPTPLGVFTVLQKQVFHRSTKYSNAPMPFMQRLTWYGIALHAGQLPGYPASHGCIRMPAEFARQLYGLTDLGMTVVITRAASAPHLAPGSDPVLPAAPAASTLPAQPFEWAPERSLTGPVSIVVSESDDRVVVLRNGKRIGSAPVIIDPPIERTVAYSLQAVDATGVRWVRLPLPGQTDPVRDFEEEWKRLILPDGFAEALAGVTAQGTTLVVTKDSLQASGAGQGVDVLSDH